MGRRRRTRKIKIIYARLVFMFVAIILIFSMLKGSQAKYVAAATSDVDVNLAYYVFEDSSISQNLRLVDILPSSSTYTYTISVANYNANDRTKTAIDYDITIRTTTNLPLEFEVHKQGSNTSVIDDVVEEADDDGTYFRTITLEGDTCGFAQNEMTIYELEIEFPDDCNDAQYEGIVEYIEVTVDARQKM